MTQPNTIAEVQEASERFALQIAAFHDTLRRETGDSELTNMLTAGYQSALLTVMVQGAQADLQLRLQAQAPAPHMLVMQLNALEQQVQLLAEQIMRKGRRRSSAQADEGAQ